ncbi:MAG: MarR family transcriptional regulator [Alistipes sp.]|nr:MarR family transcriptional regulator [Alistipes sp.]
MNAKLKLENQLCFPLYAAAKEITRRYRPLLDPFGLTYTQYIAMMALWERHRLTITELGSMLMLDSGTLTPMLKKMERDGLILRHRSDDDERKVMITLTPKGKALHDEMGIVPEQMGACVKLDSGEAEQLYGLLYKLINALK